MALCVTGQLSLREDENPKLLANRITPLIDNEHFVDSAPLADQNIPRSDNTTDSHQRTKFHVSQSAPGSFGDACYAPYQPLSNLPEPTAPQSQAPRRQYFPDPVPMPHRIYLRVDKADESDRGFRKALNLVNIFCEGGCEVVFYDKSKSEYIKLNGLKLMATGFAVNELKELLGGENVVLK